jgi:hypothetical protein
VRAEGGAVAAGALRREQQFAKSLAKDHVLDHPALSGPSPRSALRAALRGRPPQKEIEAAVEKR